MNILLMGSNGKMGKQMQLFLKEKGCNFLAIDKHNLNMISGYKADVVVDFSLAQALEQNLKIAKRKKIPIVIGTTNHNKQNLQLINEYKKCIPIFLSSNFSEFFNILLSLINNLKLIKSNQFVVTEKHHKQKQDKPSGSAKQIIKKLNLINIKPRVVCYRVGNIVGEHSIGIYGDNETLLLKHSALNRQVFCSGAYKACEFILNKPNGLYGMENLYDSK